MENGTKSTIFALVTALKSCATKKDLNEGTRLHDHILQRGLHEKNIFVGNALVSMYAKCGAFPRAHETFDQLPVRNVVSWNAVIAEYAQQEQGKEALNCYEHMQNEGVSPNAITYSCILKACAFTGAIDRGEQIHDEIVSQGLLQQDTLLGTALVDMYAKSGMLAKAQQVFDGLPIRNMVSWSTLINGYAQKGQGEEALECYKRMQIEAFLPNAITYICILQSCGILGAVNKGEQIHDAILSQGLLREHINLGNALVDMYAKCGALTKARQVLDELPVRDVISWNALMMGYNQKGQGEETLDCYDQMQSESTTRNAITCICVLKACGIVLSADRGKQVHLEIVKQGLLGKYDVLGNTLVDMYAKCSMLTKAAQVLGELLVPDVVSWSALIEGYVQQGQGKEALKCYKQMQSRGLSPNAVTYVSILKACGIEGALDEGTQIHDEVVSQGILEKQHVLLTTLVDMYAKCGALTKAQELHDKFLARDVVSWSALIAGYIHNGQGEDAVICYDQMQKEGVSPNAITYACMLKAYGITRDIDRGKHMHNEIKSQGLLRQNPVLGTALVDMYTKCGVLTKAQCVVDELFVREVVSWNALVAGYAQHGQIEEAFDCFQRMQNLGVTPDIASWNALIGGYARQGQVEKALACFQQMQQGGIFPNGITFVGVLQACGHSGLTSEAYMYFQDMRYKYGIEPVIEHHTCMVGLLGQMGYCDKAMAVVEKMPVSLYYLPVWSGLLSSCGKWGNVKLGKLAFEQVVQLDAHCAAAYVCMRNMYAAAGMEVEAWKVELIRQRNADSKLLGRTL